MKNHPSCFFEIHKFVLRLWCCFSLHGCLTDVRTSLMWGFHWSVKENDVSASKLTYLAGKSNHFDGISQETRWFAMLFYRSLSTWIAQIEKWIKQKNTPTKKKKSILMQKNNHSEEIWTKLLKPQPIFNKNSTLKGESISHQTGSSENHRLKSTFKRGY